MKESIETSKVTYQTFVNDLKAGKISHADLYDYGDIDFTYDTKTGQHHLVEIPFQANQNPLLIRSLEEQSTSYTAHDQEYVSDVKEEMSAEKMAMFSTVGMFLTPAILALIILLQSLII